MNTRHMQLDPEGATPPAKVETPPAGGGTPEIPAAIKQEIETLRAQAAKAKELETRVSKVFGQATLEERVQATREILKQTSQMSDDQINEYLTQAFGDGSTGEPTPEPEEPAVVQDVKQLRQEMIQTRRNFLARELEDGVDTQLSGNKDVVAFVKKVEQLRGPEGTKEAVSKLKSNIRKRTIENLENRRAQNRGHFDERWVREEAARAAKDVVMDHLSVIGDLDRIGRSPETGTGSEMYLKSKPVEAPTFAGSKSRGQMETEVSAYTRDALTRLALSTDSGDPTRV